MMVSTWSRVVNSYCTTIASHGEEEATSIQQATGLQRGFGENPVLSASPALCRTSQSHQGRLCTLIRRCQRTTVEKGHVLSARWPKKLKPSRPCRCGGLDLGPQPQPPGLGYPPDLLLEPFFYFKILAKLPSTTSKHFQLREPTKIRLFKRSPTSQRCI